jgi:uncharacterized protein (TIGR02145 family)
MYYFPLMITITKILKANRHKLTLYTCINLILFYIIFLLMISFFSCKKEEEKIMMVTNDSITDVAYTTAKAYATIIDPGEGIEQHGHCWSTDAGTISVNTENKTENGHAKTSGSYSSILTNLSPGESYYVRAYITDGATVILSNKILPFHTLSLGIPDVTTGTVTNITSSSATVNATLNSLGSGASSVTQYGHSWSSVTVTPTIENDYTSSLGSKDTTGNYQSQLVGLSSNTLYYVRAYATNDAGTAYGNEIEFTTSESGGTCPATVSDYDGNVYNTVQIGNQCWMKENLKTTKYNNGTDIPLVTDNIEWGNLTTPGYCWYDNAEASYKKTYGALYNWYTVSTGNLCPTGWHVPTDGEWKQLEMYLGMSQSDADTFGCIRGTDEGGKLKETGTTHWASPNTGATNETGFTALPGGQCEEGYFDGIGIKGRWWSSSESSQASAWRRSLTEQNSTIYRTSHNKKNGYSVRCLRYY